ncbi:MAG TPA: flagellar motor switch protein FliN [Pseudidiomarina sp.]|nr:flagellar motor switch protein FliN [Pseudidiomarina sp.]
MTNDSNEHTGEQPNEQDPWADALAEEEQTQPLEGDAGNVFKPLDSSAKAGSLNDLDIIMDIPVKLSVELGRTRITIKQLLELAQGSVVELDGLAGEPMDILINGYLIAQGEVVVLDDKYGIRITEIVTPSERVQKLNR